MKEDIYGLNGTDMVITSRTDMVVIEDGYGSIGTDMAVIEDVHG